jgi:hypothetical protein
LEKVFPNKGHGAGIPTEQLAGPREKLSIDAANTGLI